MGIWAASTLWLLWIILPQIFIYMFLNEQKFSVLLDIYLGVKLLGHMVTIFNFLGSANMNTCGAKKMVIFAGGPCSWAGHWFLQQWGLPGPPAEWVTGNHGLFMLCGWHLQPLPLFLIPSCLCASQLCQSLAGVKLKWVLHVVPQKTRKGGRSLTLPSWKGELFLVWESLSVLSNPGWGVGWCSKTKLFLLSSRVVIPFVVPLRYWSFLSRLQGSPRAVSAHA